jgi:hypothetical protein
MFHREQTSLVLRDLCALSLLPAAVTLEQVNHATFTQATGLNDAQ